MRQITTYIVPVAFVAFLLPGIAHAHTALVAPYDLPVPLSLYLYACAATLILTFVVIGYVVSIPGAAAAPRVLDVPPQGLLPHIFRWCLRVLRVAALACLILSVLAGLIGIQHPLGNINITLFWLIFLLGFTYLTALIGDIYQLISPWKVPTFYTEACGLDLTKARIAYPARLGYYPAFLFYIALIWIELFVLPRPATLSVLLVVCTLITFVAVWLFGKTAWFEYGELFSVFFRLFGAIAPVAYTPIKDGRDAVISFRRPFVGLLQERPTHVSLVLFVLFMLSSTTYDAIHETELWRGLYWQNAVTLTQPLWGTNLAKAQSLLLPWYLVYQRAGLVLSPFVYLGLYLLALWIAKAVTQADIPLRRLALQFAFTIIPIALVYNITHNLTSILTNLYSS
jgi:hypothetical protein